MVSARLSSGICAFALSTLSTTCLQAEPVRLGWQVPWATQGQIVMALKGTNIAQVVGIDLSYLGFTYGGPLNRAALAGEVDVLFTADQPALTLISNSPQHAVVARLMYNRTCLYVPPQSSLTTLRDLKGRTVGGPIGAAAERIALSALSKAGIAAADVRIGNLDMAQQSALLSSSSSRAAWPNIDALFGFDPLPAVFEKAGLVRHLDCGKVVSVVVASRTMIDARRDELIKFLRALQLAWLYYAQHGNEMNRAFAAEARLEATDEVLDIAAAIEPNRAAATLNDVRLTFSVEDMSVLDEAQDFLLNRKVVDGTREYRKAIDTGPLDVAMVWPGATAAYGELRSTGK